MSCQRAHWPKHKRECKKRAAELKDEALFKESSARDECPICLLPLPLENSEHRYQPCCGKILCCGCIHATYIADNRYLCPFCRTPEATSEGEIVERTFILLHNAVIVTTVCHGRLSPLSLRLRIETNKSNNRRTIFFGAVAP